MKFQASDFCTLNGTTLLVYHEFKPLYLKNYSVFLSSGESCDSQHWLGEVNA